MLQCVRPKCCFHWKKSPVHSWWQLWYADQFTSYTCLKLTQWLTSDGRLFDGGHNNSSCCNCDEPLSASSKITMVCFQKFWFTGQSSLQRVCLKPYSSPVIKIAVEKTCPCNICHLDQGTGTTARIWIKLQQTLNWNLYQLFEVYRNYITEETGLALQTILLKS